MLPFNSRAKFDALRSESTIGVEYTALGAVLATPAVAITFKNQTNGDVIVTTDNSVAAGMIFMPPNSYHVWDIRTNAPDGDNYTFREGTQFYVKDGTTVGTTGTFYLEVLALTKAA